MITRYLEKINFVPRIAEKVSGNIPRTYLTDEEKQIILKIHESCFYCGTMPWNKLRALSNFDYNEIATTHKIMKRDVGIGYTIMRKIHYNVMRFRETMRSWSKLKYGPVVTNHSVADIMSFMTQRSSLINILQLGKILVLILISTL